MKTWQSFLIAGTLLAAAIAFRAYETDRAIAQSRMSPDVAACALENMGKAHTDKALHLLHDACQVLNP
jgi:hypothetical protein